MLHKRKYVDDEFVLYDVVGMGNNAFGLISTDNGSMIMEIRMTDNYHIVDFGMRIFVH